MEKEKSKPNKLVVLDYTTGLIHNYQIDKNIFVNSQYIKTLGYDPEKVVYMFGDLQTRDHQGVLTKTIL